MTVQRRFILALAVLAAALPLPAAAQKLDSYKIDAQKISVSGISSGGYMATQLHVAFSGSFMGVGVVAGGPFECARSGSMDYTSTAVHICTGVLGHWADPNLTKVLELTKEAEERKVIDHTSNLCARPVYLFSGTKDTTVPQSVADTLKGFYDKFGGCGGNSNNIDYVKDQPVVHAYVTDNYGPTCAELANLPNDKRTPYICNGQYDTAGAILTKIYGPLNPRVAPIAANLKTFEQKPYIMHAGSSSEDSMHKYGHVYVPTACQTGQANCALHVAIHGCKQNQDFAKDAFTTGTGYNGWAEANNIIILYPQVKALKVTNPEGCWDFWGYNRVDYYQQGGPQMWAIRAMVNGVAGSSVIPEKARGPAKP